MNFDSKKIKVKGETYTVRELSAKERQKVFKLFKAEDVDPIELQAEYIRLGCAEFKAKSTDEILELPGTLFTTLSDEVVKISGLTDEAPEQTEKNS